MNTAGNVRPAVNFDGSNDIPSVWVDSCRGSRILSIIKRKNVIYSVIVLCFDTWCREPKTSYPTGKLVIFELSFYKSYTSLKQTLITVLEIVKKSESRHPGTLVVDFSN